jgi:hypothetical protein
MLIITIQKNTGSIELKRSSSEPPSSIFVVSWMSTGGEA